jgi:hypothetical protein
MHVNLLEWRIALPCGLLTQTAGAEPVGHPLQRKRRPGSQRNRLQGSRNDCSTKAVERYGNGLEGAQPRPIQSVLAARMGAGDFLSRR